MKRFIQRALHFIERIAREGKSFRLHAKNFGISLAVTIFIDGIIPPGKSEKYQAAVERFVDKFAEPIVMKYAAEAEGLSPYPAEPESKGNEKFPIWCCWWQGEEGMPEIVKMCNRRLKSLIPENAELIMLNEHNYSDYIALPPHILDKFNRGLMSITALSDVMRVMLIAKHGGFWIDSTVFLSGEFPKEFVSGEFFTQRMFNPEKLKREICKGRWCGFLVADKKASIIFRYMSEAFCSWWERYDCIADYVIYDYFLLAAYKRIPYIRNIIDNIPDNNTDIFEMYKKLHFPYSEELLKKLTANTSLHKLTYKIDLTYTAQNGEPSLYAYLLNNYSSEEA